MKNKIILSALAIFALVSCDTKVDPPVEHPDNTQVITLKFQPMYNTEALNTARSYVTAAGDTIQYAKLKFLMSNFTLEKTDGTLVPLPNIFAYLSLLDGRDSVVIKNVPKGYYKSFRFQLGLDSVINHSNPVQWGLEHPLSPSLNEMHWGWAGGYIFNVIEGYYLKNAANAGFSFHIALERNTRVFSFVQKYDIDKDKRFVFNLYTNKYFSNTINYSLKTDGPFSHSGDVDPVMDKFIQNLNGIFELKSIN
jgi:hypothetical protein